MTTKKKPRLDRKGAVAIAKDVIAQLRLGKYIAQKGTYFNFAAPKEALFDKVLIEELPELALKQDEQLQTVMNSNPGTCEVCAIGSLFASKIRKYNGLTLGEVENVGYVDDEGVAVAGDLATEKLLKYFDIDNLRLIEHVFEGYEVENYYHPEKDWADDDVYDSFYTRVEKYYSKYRDSSDRMRAIMLNIIRNKGKFVLPKRVQ